MLLALKRFVVGVQTVERGTCPKSLMERSKCVESSVAAQQCVMWCVRCEIDPSLSGVPCLPFYRSRRSRGYRREKKENQRPRMSFEGARSSFSSKPALLTWQTEPGIAHSLILIGPRSVFVQQVVTSHPAPAGGAVQQGAKPRPYGEQTGK